MEEQWERHWAWHLTFRGWVAVAITWGGSVTGRPRVGAGELEGATLNDAASTVFAVGAAVRVRGVARWVASRCW